MARAGSLRTPNSIRQSAREIVFCVGLKLNFVPSGRWGKGLAPCDIIKVSFSFERNLHLPVNRRPLPGRVEPHSSGRLDRLSRFIEQRGTGVLRHERRF